MPKVRPARSGEARFLSELCRRSKAHWGYDAEFMRQAAGTLTVTETMIAAGDVLVAEGQTAEILGVAVIAALESADAFELALMFVEPTAIRSGFGRVLFAAAAQLAAQRGGHRLSILADPYAEGFYRRLGAVRIGEAPSDAIPGRRLPLLEYALR